MKMFQKIGVIADNEEDKATLVLCLGSIYGTVFAGAIDSDRYDPIVTAKQACDEFLDMLMEGAPAPDINGS